MKKLAFLAVLLSLWTAPALADISVSDMMKDRVVGDENAPMTIIEYASLTCPSCRAFHENTWPEVKKELVDTGKAKFIFRDFPLDQHAVKAAKLSRCVSPDMYHDVVSAIFAEQPKWTKMDNPVNGLTEIGKAAGMDAGSIGACLGNADLEDAILKGMQDAQEKYRVRRTPSFVFFQGKKKVREFPEFDAIREKTGKPHGDGDGHQH